MGKGSFPRTQRLKNFPLYPDYIYLLLSALFLVTEQLLQYRSTEGKYCLQVTLNSFRPYVHFKSRTLQRLIENGGWIKIFSDN